jgi:hypothetical protein
VKAEQRVYCDERHPTRLELGVLPPS